MANFFKSTDPALPSQDAAGTKTLQDSFTEYLDAPARKLDADEYVATDFDGVAESLLGSGNMNFLMMQAAQTNASVAPVSYSDEIDAGELGGSFHLPVTGDRAPLPVRGGDDVSMDRGADIGNDTGVQTAFPVGSNIAASSLGATSSTATSQISKEAGGVSEFTNIVKGTSGGNGDGGPAGPQGTSGVNGKDGSDGTDGNDGSDGDDGNDGTNGHDGRDGADGKDGHDGHSAGCGCGGGCHCGGGDTTINIVNISDNDTTIHNVFNDNRIIGDIIVNPGDGPSIVETVFNSVTQITNNAADNLFTTVNTVTNNLFDTVNTIGEGDGGLSPLGLHLDALAGDATSLNLDIIRGSDIATVINETIDLSSVVSPVTTLLGNPAAGLSVDTLFNPLHYDSAPQDTDLQIAVPGIPGTPLHDLSLGVPLDAAEILLGDIDATADLSHVLPDLTLGGGNPNDTDLHVTGLEPVTGPLLSTGALNIGLNLIEDLAGDIDIAPHAGLALLGTNDPSGVDQDITVPIDINFIGGNVLTDTLSLSLDPVEPLTGDIDLAAPVAVDLLGQAADSLIDNGHGGSADANILSQAGDTISSVANGLVHFDQGENTDLGLLTTAGGPLGSIASNDLALALDPVESVTDGIVHAALPVIDATTDGALAFTDDALNAAYDNLSATATGAVQFSVDAMAALDDNLSASVGGTAQFSADVLAGAFDGIDGAIGMLDSAAQSAGGFLSGVTAGVGNAAEPLSSWTENVLPDPGNLLGGSFAHLSGALEHTGVDSLSSVVPQISIPSVPVADNLLSGGGTHHGGLFG